MKMRSFLLCMGILAGNHLWAQITNVKVDFSRELGPMKMEQMALGQGG